MSFVAIVADSLPSTCWTGVGLVFPAIIIICHFDIFTNCNPSQLSLKRPIQHGRQQRPPKKRAQLLPVADRNSRSDAVCMSLRAQVAKQSPLETEDCFSKTRNGMIIIIHL